MSSRGDDRLAVLIDADNAQPLKADALMEEVSSLGTATVRRIYGDWTTPQLGSWKEAANRHAIQPMQQFAHTRGKNSTDSALIIDAMDLLYGDRLDGFVLVSSDSDFTWLASRLRESGKTVYGIGERHTPEAFRAACDRFIYADVLGQNGSTEGDESGIPETTVSASVAVATKRPSGASSPAKKAAARPSTPTRKTSPELKGDSGLVKVLRSAVAASSDDDGWANLGQVGSTAGKQSPDFDPRNWRYAKLVDLVTATGLFEVKRPAGGGVAVRSRKR